MTDGTYFLMAIHRYVDVPKQPAEEVMLGVGSHPSSEYDFELKKVTPEQAEQIRQILEQGESCGIFSRPEHVSAYLHQKYPNAGRYLTKAEMGDPDYADEQPKTAPEPLFYPQHIIC